MEARKRRNKNKRNKKREQKRSDCEENPGKQFEQEKRVMKLEKINVILKRAIKKPRQSNIRHRLNKTTSINSSASFLRLHQSKSAAILRVLKKKNACFYEKRSYF